MLRVMARILTAMLSNHGTRLDDGQRDAIMEAVLLTLVTPGLTGDRDRLWLRHGLLSLPWAGGASSGELRRLSSTEGADYLLTFGRSLSRELQHARLRELVFRVMAGLLFADGGTDRDLPILEPLRIGLDISPARAGEIIDMLKDEIVAMVM